MTDAGMRLEAKAFAQKTLDVLDQLGFNSKPKKGSPVRAGIQFSRILMDETHLMLEVDHDHLPDGVTMEPLKSNRVLDELSTQLQRSVGVLNTTGITFVIDKRRPVLLPQRVELETHMIPADLPYPIPIGVDAHREYFESLLSTYNILVGGMTRYGKSNWIQGMLYSLLTTTTPAELDLMLVDNKVVEFSWFNGIPHLHGRTVATTQEAALELLREAMDIVSERQTFLLANGARNLREYNAKNPDGKLPLVLIVVDEVVDLLLSNEHKAEVEKLIIRIGQIGTGFGVQMVLATQKPRHDVLSTLISGNFETHVGFRTNSWQASRMIIGMRGLESLPQSIRGRMITNAMGDNRTLQAMLVDTDKITALCNELRGGPMQAEHIVAQERVHRVATAITDLEQSIARFCRDDNHGKFSVRTVYVRFAGQISHHDVAKLGRRWQTLGWLSGNDGSTGRDLMPALLELIE